jgi:hypothetical protein
MGPFLPFYTTENITLVGRNIAAASPSGLLALSQWFARLGFYLKTMITVNRPHQRITRMQKLLFYGTITICVL